jgi:hypothetical protein
LCRVIQQDDWNEEENESSQQKVWEVENVRFLSSQVDAFVQISVHVFEFFGIKSILVVPNENVEADH